MESESFNKWVTLAANIGVIAGIIFLAIELRQNTDAQMSQTIHSLNTDMREIFDMTEDYINTTSKNHSALTQEEKLIRRTWFTRVMRIYENQWYQYTRGYLDEEFFRAYQQHLRITLGTEDYADLWELRTGLGFFHSGFVQYVDTYLANNPPYSTEEIRLP